MIFQLPFFRNNSLYYLIDVHQWRSVRTILSHEKNCCSSCCARNYKPCHSCACLSLRTTALWNILKYVCRKYEGCLRSEYSNPVFENSHSALSISNLRKKISSTSYFSRTIELPFCKQENYNQYFLANWVIYTKLKAPHWSSRAYQKRIKYYSTW